MQQAQDSGLYVYLLDEDYKEAVSQFLNSVDRELNAFLHARKAEEYEPAVQLIINAQDRGNRLHITGIGKPGHVSPYMGLPVFLRPGTPAIFSMEPRPYTAPAVSWVAGDVVICISNSGETGELKATVEAVKNNGCKVIGVSGHPESWLARESDVFLFAGVNEEGGPLNRAPRNSILAEILTLQALSVALQARRGWTPEQYVRCHPGGALGKLREEEKTAVGTAEPGRTGLRNKEGARC